jgi:glycosyltransferase involved in cell wall biosynthesis
VTPGLPPAIAVVIRCHDQGRFLTDAVRSACAQTRPPDEVVIIDDGSTDDTHAVARALAADDPRLSVIHRTPAQGAVRSLNDGLAASTAPLICVLDADDRLSSRYLELTAAAIEAPDVGFAYTEVRTFGAATEVHPPVPFSVGRMLVENPVSISALFRRSMLEQVGPFDEGMDRLGLEDWEFWLRCVAAGWSGCVANGCWLEYRKHATASRNTIRRSRGLRVRAVVWWRYRRLLKPSHVVGYVALVVRRRVRRHAS